MRTRQSRMSSFSQWQDDQNNDSPNNNNNTNSAGNGGLSNLSFGGIFGGEDGDGNMTLPLFNDGSIPSDFGWGNLKSSMEAQMPQKVLGMNYQERFRVRFLKRSSSFCGICTNVIFALQKQNKKDFVIISILNILTHMIKYKTVSHIYNNFIFILSHSNFPMFVAIVCLFLFD